MYVNISRWSERWQVNYLHSHRCQIRQIRFYVTWIPTSLASFKASTHQILCSGSGDMYFSVDIQSDFIASDHECNIQCIAKNPGRYCNRHLNPALPILRLSFYHIQIVCKHITGYLWRFRGGRRSSKSFTSKKFEAQYRKHRILPNPLPKSPPNSAGLVCNKSWSGKTFLGCMSIFPDGQKDGKSIPCIVPGTENIVLNMVSTIHTMLYLYCSCRHITSRVDANTLQDMFQDLEINQNVPSH